MPNLQQPIIAAVIVQVPTTTERCISRPSSLWKRS